MTDGVLAVDQHGRIFFSNRALEAVPGYTSTELADVPVEELVPTARRGLHQR